MSFGNSQVVGVIELDRPLPTQYEHPLSPAARTARRPHASLEIAHVVAASDDDEVITADVRQLKRELRAELAYVLSRLRRKADAPK